MCSENILPILLLKNARALGTCGRSELFVGNRRRQTDGLPNRSTYSAPGLYETFLVQRYSVVPFGPGRAVLVVRAAHLS